MASPAKQPQRKGGWGSLLSGAVAGLESRLDTILAEDSEASARQRAGENALNAAKAGPRTEVGNLAVPAKGSGPSSRDVSRSRVNEKLAERLAKATAKKDGSQTGSTVPSRVASPANDTDSARTSGELRRSSDVPRSVPEVKQEEEDNSQAETALGGEKPNGQTCEAVDETLLSSELPINPARVSSENPRPSIEIPSEETSYRTSAEAINGIFHSARSQTELEIEMQEMRQDHAQAEKQRQEEMHAYLEKIDALQAKLSYLAKETVAAAKEANASASGNAERRLAEKDERIALLMEEGEKLSKTELRHLQTIKKLRAKTSEEEKSATEVKKQLERAERSESDLKQRVRRAEAAERQASEKARQISNIEKQLEELRIDRENASQLIRALTTQLKEANEKSEKAVKQANSKAAEIDRSKLASLQNELEDAQIEKKLVEDRSRSELGKVREELDRQKERFGVTEVELKNEISGLEARVEAMRSLAEEASSDVAGSDSNVKLLRQIETLQSQYSFAKENWGTIEGSLNARVSQLEKERDEAARREAEVRKKARDASNKIRKVEDELETAHEQVRGLSQDVRSLREELKTSQRKLDNAESTLTDAKADAEKQRKLWDVELTQRLDEEKLKWQRATHQAPATIRNEISSRKTSAADISTLYSSRRPTNRLTSQGLANLHTETQQRPVTSSSRRSSVIPPTHNTVPRTPLDASPRHETSFTLDQPPTVPPTPSIEIEPDFESPHLSTSTAAAGPSVQLVERMSAAVRRLESEKATFKDEIARLAGQRDEARDEVVRLMREVEGPRQRYEASLEMLGEREEEVEELKGDVEELKRIYRELVESKVGPA